ncbi:MAG: helix-turn-helix transcriptional regulator [Nitrospinae bacterium]|nr:helix-turn-helix transcriptional regulator [Nitrospinota bacterium]
MKKKLSESGDILRAFGSAIRLHRANLGISQEELADHAGLHRTYISDIERGTRNVSLLNLVRLADALRVPISNLFSADIFAKRKG